MEETRGSVGHLGALSHETKVAAAVVLLSFLAGRMLIAVASALGTDPGFLRSLGLEPGDFATLLFGSGQNLSSALCQWDCFWYDIILSEGYDVPPREEAMRRGQGVWAFFPLFPVSVRGIAHVLPLSPLGTAYLFNNACLLAAGWLLYLMVRDHQGPRTGHRTGLIAAALFLCSPFSLYLSVPYTEALFNLLSIVVFYMAYQGRWLASGLAMALLTATRPTGLFIVIPVLVIAVREVGGLRRLIRLHEHANIMLAFALCPLGISLFAVYLYFLHGDALAFTSVQAAWQQQDVQVFLARIFRGFFEAAPGLTANITAYQSVAALVAISAVAALVYLRRIPEAVFLGVIVLISTSYSLRSTARYAFALWPAYLLLATALRSRPTVSLVVILLLALTLIPYTIGWVNSSIWTV